MRYSLFKYWYNKSEFVRPDEKKMPLKDFIKKHDMHRGGNLNAVFEFFDEVLDEQTDYDNY